MALPQPNLKLVKKKPSKMDDLEFLANAKAAEEAKPAKSETNVEIAKGMNSYVDRGGSYKDIVAPGSTKKGYEGGKVTTSPVTKPGMTVTTSERVPLDEPSGEEDDLDYLARVEADLQDERDATQAELKAGKARAVQETRAKAGAAGMGLSGASAALESDVSRQQDRSIALAMAELDRMQRDDKFTAIQQQGAIMDIEDAYDVDMDGDGTINGTPVNLELGYGDGDPDNDVPADPSGVDVQKEALANQNSIYDVDDYSWWDEPNAAPGSIQAPFKYRGGKSSLEAMLADVAPDALPLTKKIMDTGNPTDPKREIWVDKFGNCYVLDSSQSTRRG